MARAPAVLGWTAAALAVSGTLTMPACGGVVTSKPEGADAGVALAASGAPAAGSGGSTSTGGADAGPDASAVDAGDDGGPAPSDAGIIIVLDAGPSDANPDADEPIYESGIC